MMKKRLFSCLVYVLLLGTLVIFLASCSDDDNEVSMRTVTTGGVVEGKAFDSGGAVFSWRSFCAASHRKFTLA